MSVDLIQLWHSRARPHPDEQDFNIQLGVHFEEICEMLEELRGDDDYSHTMLVRATTVLHKLAEAVKSGDITVAVSDRVAFLDSLCDQIVTAVGVGHCANMNITEAVRRVNTSNWTKTVDGEFLRDMHGKIIKPEGYQPPDLGGLT
jgi:predicted HAD superfamily Cof-like phosphohydrolase